MMNKQQCQSLCDHFGVTLERAVEVLNHNRDPVQYDSIYYWLNEMVGTEKQYGVGDAHTWIIRWRLLYSDDFVRHCVKFLSFHRRDHRTAQGTFIKGIHHDRDLCNFIITKKLYRAAEEWAKARVEGERIKRTMSLKEELELIKEMREAM